ncbi:hypothetical protein [Laspinema palackyanum]|uniref:hypothetical protein n=1 Tax=Laspinema palackyanum TaxID=3231601 RepID=UPI00345D68E7|nr:hypothetical protein [Laspinema sp. D2c]
MVKRSRFFTQLSWGCSSIFCRQRSRPGEVRREACETMASTPEGWQFAGGELRQVNLQFALHLKLQNSATLQEVVGYP